MKKPYQVPTIEFVYLGLPKKTLLDDFEDRTTPDVIGVIQGSTTVP